MVQTNVGMVCITLTALALCNYVLHVFIPKCRNLGRLLRGHLHIGFNGIKYRVLQHFSTTPFDAKVKRKVLEIQVNRFQTFADTFQGLVSISAAYHLLKSALKQSQQSHDVQEDHQNVFVLHASMLLSFQLFNVLSQEGKQRFLKIMPWFVNLCIVFLRSKADIEVMTMQRPVAVCIRALLAVFMGEPVAISFQNVLHGAINSRLYYLMALPHHRQLVTTERFIRQEVFMSLLIAAISWSLQKSLKSEAQESLHRKEQASSKLTVNSLLAVLSDAVVLLDSDMAILQPTPKLSAMLNLANRSLEGHSFTKLVNTDDSERVLEQCRHAQQSMHAQTINVQLIDANSMPVHVQLLLACFWNWDDKPVYIVGIVELSRDVAWTTDPESDRLMGASSEMATAESLDLEAPVGAADPTAAAAVQAELLSMSNTTSELGSIPEDSEAPHHEIQNSVAARVDNMIEFIKAFEHRMTMRRMQKSSKVFKGLPQAFVGLIRSVLEQTAQQVQAQMQKTDEAPDRPDEGASSRAS